MDNKAGRNIRIMGIVNITGDSFFAGSRMLASDGRLDEAVFRRRVEGMLGEGADILDFGACSTRPGSESVSEEEEWSRLEPALRIIAREYPGICLSVDTFRPGIVRKVHDLVGGFIVNDISGGCDAMWELLGELKVPYVAMHMRGTPADLRLWQPTMVLFIAFILATALLTAFLSIRFLRKRSGASKGLFAACSVCCYGVLYALDLPATMAANFMALRNGADILRVHDVKEARETVRLYGLYMG